MVPVCALLVLLLKASEAVTSMNNRYRIKIDYIDYGAMFYQTYGPSGEYLLDYNGNEMFHVDLESKSVVWTLPGLEKYTLFDPQAALQQINVAKYNLDIRIKRSNHTVAPNIPPLVSVYISNAVVLGEPNILICCTKNIFPPVMNTTWIKNGEIIRGFKETSYLPAQDGTFRKLHYLAFIPNDHDIYTCEVEHWGLERPTKRIWSGLNAGHIRTCDYWSVLPMEDTLTFDVDVSREFAFSQEDAARILFTESVITQEAGAVFVYPSALETRRLICNSFLTHFNGI
ncbi:H-2 class II histocompatibility antigen, A-U alpha chain [Xenopus laevis]|uniref:H-2 class II histocompatibility antigen, A-U alpha chain n=1 Tax=Xenopus laevis TaxID=8355 RepID=A0A8J1LI91_XENLA|nr:H-2 class II histocompatibility antigen, A-U alpha chain [Xenopus laevis]